MLQFSLVMLLYCCFSLETTKWFCSDCLLFLNEPFCLSSADHSAMQDPKTATLLKHQNHESHQLHERSRQNISSEIRFVQKGNTFAQTNCCSCKIFLLIFKCKPFHSCLEKVLKKMNTENKNTFWKIQSMFKQEAEKFKYI